MAEQAGQRIGLGVAESDPVVRTLHERFVSDPANTDLSSLRPLIARSWLRSVACKVDPALTQFQEAREPRLDEQLMLGAGPVLEDLSLMAADTSASVCLADPNGTIGVFIADADVRRAADLSSMSNGSVMAEDFVGTNGEGTAIEEGCAVQVWGAEHFNVGMQDFYCTSVPIMDPLRHTVRAILSLSLPGRVAASVDPRSVALIARGAAAELHQLLAARLAVREQALLSTYLAEVRKRGADSVVVMDERTTIASRGALQMLGEGDYTVLAGYARESERLTRPLEREMALGAQSVLHVEARPIESGGETMGSIMRLRLAKSTRRAKGVAPVARRTDQFKTLAGESITLRRALQVAGTAVRRRLPAYILGEAGTGKTTLAAAMAAELSDAVTTWDPERGELGCVAEVDAVGAALDGGAAVVIRHADRLSDEVREVLAELLAGRDNPMVLLTMSRLREEDTVLTDALAGVEIELPPLRQRREDIPVLVGHFLASAAHGVLRVSPALLRLLTKADWGGNVAQLRHFVDTAAARCETVELGLQHVSETHRRALSPTPLSRLEEAELRQIREAIADADGNRVRAAELLEIGRSTLYRKIDMYQRRGYELEL